MHLSNCTESVLYVHINLVHRKTKVEQKIFSSLNAWRLNKNMTFCIKVH